MNKSYVESAARFLEERVSQEFSSSILAYDFAMSTSGSFAEVDFQLLVEISGFRSARGVLKRFAMNLGQQDGVLSQPMHGNTWVECRYIQSPAFPWAERPLGESWICTVWSKPIVELPEADHLSLERALDCLCCDTLDDPEVDQLRQMVGDLGSVVVEFEALETARFGGFIQREQNNTTVFAVAIDNISRTELLPAFFERVADQIPAINRFGVLDFGRNARLRSEGWQGRCAAVCASSVWSQHRHEN